MNSDIFITIALLAVGLPVGMVLVAILLKRAKTRSQTHLGQHQTIGGDNVQQEQKSQINSSEEVGQFYDQQTDAFLATYGEIIQAFRTKDPKDLLDQQFKAIGLEMGNIAVDAGCGVAGPAIYFAERTGATIKAITISQVQANKAKTAIEAKNLNHLVDVYHADYHQMHELLGKEIADQVYFLESFGHSHNQEEALNAAWEVLKPGGKLYIKDLFLKEPLDERQNSRMQLEVDRINKAYRYNIADLYHTIRILRKKGWILSKLKTIDLPLEKFENLSVSNDFQELTGIGKIDNWAEYVFPVEFFELHCYKPWFDPLAGDSRYFLQNLYYHQVHGMSEAEIANKKMAES